MPLSGLTLRLEKGSPLSAQEGDDNTKILRNGIDSLMQLFGVSLNPDGTLKSGSLNNVNQITDGLITAVKLAADALVPIGSMIFTPVATVPTNYLEANGDSKVRADYVALFALYGTTFGSLSGTTFNLPDFRGLFPMGRSGSYAINTTGGAATHLLTQSELPATIEFITNLGATDSSVAGQRIASTVNGTNPTPTVIGVPATVNNPPGGNAHSILNPYRTGLWLIKAL